MIGHNQIIAARMQGKKPSCVFVNFVNEIPKFRGEINNPENALSFGLYPDIWIECGEIADVRMLTGCKVIACGESWSESYFDLLDKITGVQPEMILAMADDGEMRRWNKNYWEAL